MESSLSKRAFGKELELDLLDTLGKGMVVVVGCYGLLRFWDLGYRGNLKWLMDPSQETILFYLEMALLVAAPVGLLAWRRVRAKPELLFTGALCAVPGFVLNRLNVVITGMQRGIGANTFPTWMEWSLTLALAAAGFAVFARP